MIHEMSAVVSFKRPIFLYILYDVSDLYLRNLNLYTLLATRMSCFTGILDNISGSKH